MALLEQRLCAWGRRSVFATTTTSTAGISSGADGGGGRGRLHEGNLVPRGTRPGEEDELLRLALTHVRRSDGGVVRPKELRPRRHAHAHRRAARRRAAGRRGGPPRRYRRGGRRRPLRGRRRWWLATALRHACHCARGCPSHPSSTWGGHRGHAASAGPRNRGAWRLGGPGGGGGGGRQRQQLGGWSWR